MKYYIVQNEFKKTYSKAQVFLVSSIFKFWVCIKSLTSSKDLYTLFVKVRLNFAHIFSAGFNSGLYGGKKIRIILSGTFNLLALWNAPLSSTINFSSSGFINENSLRNSSKLSVLQKGKSNKNDDPSIGENAPNM